MSHMSRAKALTEITIQNAKPKDKPYNLSDGGGLYLEVTPGGSKLWRYVFRAGGKQYRGGLGKWGVPPAGLSLKGARLAYAEKLAGAAAGVKPTKTRGGPAVEVVTFGDVVEEWARAFLVPGSLTPATIRSKKVLLRAHLLPALGALPIAEIEPSTVLERLLRPAQARGNLETAHRLKSFAGQIFRYAVGVGYAQRDPTQDLRGVIPPAKVRHFSTITDEAAIGRLLLDIDGYAGHVVTRFCLQLAPLVFLRPGELRRGCWCEINWPGAVWRVPAERMKMKATHVVPLSNQALALLRGLHAITGGGELMFPGQRAGRPICDVTLIAALRYLGYGRDDISPHGFRSMASTILNEKGYNRDWIERQLAHAERNTVRAAYNYAEYLPERARMMQEWADYLDSLKAAAKKG